jgi:hypothetical protein
MIKIRKIIILPLGLYGCETLSLALREEHRLRMFGNSVLRSMFGPKRDKIIGDWRKLRSEKHHDLHSSPNIIIKSRRLE